MTTEKALNRLTKWRSVLAGWQLGSKTTGAPGLNAVRDHRELSLILRCEQTALTGLLLEKGVFTAKEIKEAIEKEAELLEQDMQRKFPGMAATDDGIRMDPQIAVQTMRQMGFPE